MAVAEAVDVYAAMIFAHATPSSKRSDAGSCGRRILYLSGTLPARSETFVYREVFELRRRGRLVTTASVHPPERSLGARELDRLAAEAVQLYDSHGRLLLDALREWLGRPVRTTGTLLRAAADAAAAREVSLTRRLKILYQSAAASALARRVRPLGIAHIHSHMAHVPTTIAMYAARQLGVSFSFTGHAVDLFRDGVLLTEKLRRAAFVACISRWHRDFYRRMSNGSSTPMPLVRCGVDVRAFSPPAPDAGNAAGEPLTILAVGRLVPKKGFDLLLRACARLAGARHRCRCIVVGDGPEREALEAARDELRLGEDVHLTGARDNDHVRRMMRQADLFVLPCRVDSSGDRDGIPVVLMEAMASGLPVISGDLPAIRELIEHDRSGLLVDAQRSDGAVLAQAITELARNERKRKRLGRAARRRIEEEFALDINVTRLERAFDRVLGGSRRRPVRAWKRDRWSSPAHSAT